jgi:DNA adenine methylase
MTIGTFNYPGGKTTIAQWIINQLPEHEVYVEPFGGSAGVMANKPESPLEVYNDTASLCVDFFRAVKHRPDELEHWVQTTPYSRELFEEYTEKLQQDPPEDLVERAGMFWFMQSAAFAGSGILSDGGGTSYAPSTRATRSPKPRKTKSQADNINNVCERFRTVQIEHLDFETVFEKYDSQDTVFYCDPPYVGDGEACYETGKGNFNHSRFVESLHDLDGKWLISYGGTIPSGLSDYTVINRQKQTTMGTAKPKKTETLIMNYDPKETTMFRSNNQSGLEAYSD